MKVVLKYGQIHKRFVKNGQIHKRFVNIFTDLLTSYVIIFTTMGL